MYNSDVPFTRVHVTGSSISFLNDVRTNDKGTFHFLVLFYVFINVFPSKIFVFLQIVFLYIVSEPSNNCSYSPP